MDLKSMLNEASTHKHAPSLTPHSPPRASEHGASPASQRALSQHPVYPRDTPSKPPPLQPPDPRSPGSYFPTQSPYQQHHPATTPVANGGQRYVQSPAAYGVTYSSFIGNPPPGSPGHITREYEEQLSHEYTTRARASGRPPEVQWGDFLRMAVERKAQQEMMDRPGSSHSSPPPPAPYAQSSHLRQNSTPLSASPYSYQSRNVLSSAHLHSQPATPLGPPGPYTRPSPQTQRPLSQGYDHYRTHSSSSISSQFAQEQAPRVSASPQQTRTQTTQRQYSMDSERDRSQSVSPKTIPQSLPARQASTQSPIQLLGTPAPSQQARTVSIHSLNAMPFAESQTNSLRGSPTPISSATTPNGNARGLSQPPNSQPSPVVKQIQPPAPKFSDEPPIKRESPNTQKHTNLKRSASTLSGSSSTTQPMRKKLRRDDVPIFAQSARKKPVRLSKSSGIAIVSQPLARIKDHVNGHTPTNGSAVVQPTVDAAGLPFESSIMNKVPYEDLTRRICDWIVQTIGMAEPPSGGAVFEIEAKVGEIHDIERGQRLTLPVSTEAIFIKEKFGRTKFESSMNMVQHKKLNDFLNNAAKDSHQGPSRIPIHYDHRRESDQFYELTAEGIRELPPSIRQWTKHRPRVRITNDLDTLALKAKIIKSRIADLEIYNPGADFDYRISVSIESPWDGNMMSLTPLEEQGAERNKDRVSYRHMAYQIDLTQVSYPDSAKREHELEVEISTEQIRAELGHLTAGRSNRYEDLVKGFVDNVRVLCRAGTLKPTSRS